MPTLRPLSVLPFIAVKNFVVESIISPEFGKLRLPSSLFTSPIARWLVEVLP